jgi:hypothetical protein
MENNYVYCILASNCQRDSLNTSKTPQILYILLPPLPPTHTRILPNIKKDAQDFCLIRYTGRRKTKRDEKEGTVTADGGPGSKIRRQQKSVGLCQFIPSIGRRRFPNGGSFRRTL